MRLLISALVVVLLVLLVWLYRGQSDDVSSALDVPASESQAPGAHPGGGPASSAAVPGSAGPSGVNPTIDRIGGVAVEQVEPVDGDSIPRGGNSATAFPGNPPATNLGGPGAPPPGSPESSGPVVSNPIAPEDGPGGSSFASTGEPPEAGDTGVPGLAPEAGQLGIEFPAPEAGQPTDPGLPPEASDPGEIGPAPEDDPDLR